MKRLKKEGGKWRRGEKKLEDFWSDEKKSKKCKAQEAKKHDETKTNSIIEECTQTKKLKPSESSE